MATKKTSPAIINVEEIGLDKISFRIIGRTPFIANAMSAKVRQELLLPKGRKTAADKAASLKHDPPKEMRGSIYRAKDDMPTLVCIPSTMIKAALRNAAVDLPGTTKAQIGRLTYVEGDYLPLYGQPEMLMSVTRSSDINRTPDVRTRAIFPEWAVECTVKFVGTLLKAPAVSNLLAAAGVMQGLGDWRPERGKGDYGQFELANFEDKRFDEIIARGGRDAQEAAMRDFAFYDYETEELYKWWEAETKRRGFKVA